MNRHPGDTYVGDDGRTLRLINERLVVRMDPEKETVGSSGLLVAPPNAHEHIYATGEILAFGYVTEKKLADTTKTKKVEPHPIPDLEVGLKCSFIKFRKLQDSNLKVQEMYGDGVILLKTEDILFVYPRDFTFELGQ